MFALKCKRLVILTLETGIPGLHQMWGQVKCCGILKGEQAHSEIESPANATQSRKVKFCARLIFFFVHYSNLNTQCRQKRENNKFLQ